MDDLEIGYVFIGIIIGIVIGALLSLIFREEFGGIKKMKYLLMFLVIMLGSLLAKDVPANWQYLLGYIVASITMFIACNFD